MKLVKESLYEKFSEGGDPIYDMGIDILPKYQKELDDKYRWERNKFPEGKDRMRIKDIVSKAQGDSAKEMKLAETMCKLITDPLKAYRRFQAAREIMGMKWGPSSIFLIRAAELAGIK
jgi:hypothetical protein